ncbi:LOW QUALITY PROTEIN: phosphoenolpyruvate carboxylase kinase 1-like [Dioscorea cayenensis subsp. rotundata]|uniref:LOW QUALITY PROTEIN: phosphoenolpyruvate carboxylase kinase 1-like n=1 Tax=Dioscorea cayennensis subsp. rotundata TaxID=55577 RepID=A0AB40C215_DIOCR|nr:LOW QUALITY PROTEIN: phosphoenolpyruvate carboxylase kinase 1-like [Dioscorea cayenensis subsp. rotundata]
MSEALKADYEIGAEIGRGRFGAVFHCYSVTSGEPFAVKTIDKTLLTDSTDRQLVDREAKITLLAAAGNPHVVQIYAVYEDDSSIHLVLDLLPGPDLFERISAVGSPMPEPEAAAIIAQLMEALHACHQRGVAHRDVKPDNVMFDSRGRLRLVDFGSAECFGEGRPMRGVVGTPYYVAPEVVAGREYGEKVDVWSAGVILYMMLGGIPPFYGETAVDIFEAVLRGNLRFPTRIFSSVSPAAKDLMRRMICRDPSRRFSADQVLRHSWIVGGGGALHLT